MNKAIGKLINLKLDDIKDLSRQQGVVDGSLGEIKGLITFCKDVKSNNVAVSTIIDYINERMDLLNKKMKTLDNDFKRHTGGVKK